MAISSLVLIANGGSLLARKLLSIFLKAKKKVYKQKPEFYSRCFGNEQKSGGTFAFLLEAPLQMIRGAIYRAKKQLTFGSTKSEISLLWFRTIPCLGYAEKNITRSKLD